MKLYKKFTFAVAFASLIACGQAPTKEEAEAEKVKSKETETKSPSVDGEKPAQESEPVTPNVTAPKALTKEQQLQVFTRLAFDTNFKKGNMFTVDGLYYILKGSTGTMGFPDVQIVGNAKDAKPSCPIGFTVIDRIQLSIAYQKGLLSALPTDKQWVWTIDKPSDITQSGYYTAMPSQDFVRSSDGYQYYAGFFYTARGSQIDGQVYCAMSVHDLPKIEDMPPYMQDVLASISADPND